MKYRLALDQILFFIAFSVLAYFKLFPVIFSDPNQWIIETLLSIFFAMIILSIHTNVQWFFAHLAGDINVKIQRKMKWFSFSFVDAVGIIPLIFFQMGWGRSIDSEKAYKGSKKGQRIWILASGPLAILLLSFVLQISAYGIEHFSLTMAAITELFARLSLYFGIINFLPIPPFNGWYIAGALFKKNMKINDHRNYGLMLLFILFSYDTLQNFIRWIAEHFLLLF